MLVEKATINIRLGRETQKRLQRFGDMGDTFDTLINKLLDEIEVCRKTKISK